MGSTSMLAQAVTLQARRPMAIPALRIRRVNTFASSSSKNSPSTLKAHAHASKSQSKAIGLALAALIASSGGVMVDEAMAARSGGRVGGSSFRSAPRASTSSRRSGGGSYGSYVAPPVMGYGYGVPMMPGFGYGYGFSPFFFGGGIFQFMIFLFVINSVLNVLSSVGKNNDKDGDDGDDFYDV